jgi:hypothetical protein
MFRHRGSRAGASEAAIGSVTRALSHVKGDVSGINGGMWFD